MKPIQLEIGKAAPDEGTRSRVRLRFWRTSYDGGPEYKDGRDAGGEPILVPHEGESKEGLARRRRLATYVNFCGAICDRYASMIFSKPILRDHLSDPWVEFCADADTGGSSLSTMMEDACRLALAEGEHWFVMDSTREPGNETIAQAEAADDRPFLVDVDPRLVLAWRGLGSRVDQCLIHLPDEKAVRLYDADRVLVGFLDDSGMIKSIIEIPHEFGMTPVVRLAPLGGRSLIRDIADSNKLLFNLQSVLSEEIQRQTWTQWVADGLDAKKLKSAVAGGRRIWCIGNADSKNINFTALKGDVSQAGSIRESMAGVVNDIYRQVGMRMPDMEQGSGPESGRALRIRQDEMAHMARAISMACEKADNQVLDLFMAAMDLDGVKPTEYPMAFDSETETVALQDALQVISSTLPLEIKRAYVRRVARTLCEDGDPAEVARLETSVETMGDGVLSKQVEAEASEE